MTLIFYASRWGRKERKMKFRAVLAALLASMIIFAGCTDGNEPNANVENANNDNVTVESTGDNEIQKEEEEPEAEEEEKEVELELVLTIDVKTTGYELVGGHNATIVMIPFVGSAHGDYFNGDIVGTGYDTQTIIDDVTHFSARYMIRGTDANGQACTLFIENNGTDLAKCVPTIYTDSALLEDWETSDMRSVVTVVEGGVCINVYKATEVEE